MTVPHLDDGIVSEILYRLPTNEAYRLAAVCRQWRAVLSQPTFLCRHLSPRPLPLLDDRPYALIIQPRWKVGFTHLTLVAFDPANSVRVRVPVQPKYTSAHAPEHPAASPMETAPFAMKVEEYVVFFERTVPMLDISVVASHGRLLLCRSRVRYYVCDPAANRWLALPPSTISQSSMANSGLHYDVDESTGRFVFTVVHLVRCRRRRVLVETFSSASGRWDARELAAPGVARCLPSRDESPGIHVGMCFYWLTRRWGGGRRRIISYDATHCRVSVLHEPPLAEKAKDRMGRSLGSVGGRLRLCAYDIREDSESMLPSGHNHYMQGVHGVWLMDAASVWRRVHEAVVQDVSTYYSILIEEPPVDLAGASGEFIVLEKLKRLLRYNLESGSKVELVNLEIGGIWRSKLYRHYNAFPFFK
ncbi:hypothetical protein VPH35_008936 [Triticum aestivum]|uniref:F-box domain-containing protein n=1 Tax=Triticum aestivum TaxID=4565 RepID=A0A3B5YZ11_WHEAT